MLCLSLLLVTVVSFGAVLSYIYADHIIFSGWVAEWPPLRKELLRLTLFPFQIYLFVIYRPNMTLAVYHGRKALKAIKLNCMLNFKTDREKKQYDTQIWNLYSSYIID